MRRAIHIPAYNTIETGIECVPATKHIPFTGLVYFYSHAVSILLSIQANLTIAYVQGM